MVVEGLAMQLAANDVGLHNIVMLSYRWKIHPFVVPILRSNCTDCAKLRPPHDHLEGGKSHHRLLFRGCTVCVVSGSFDSF